jgi:hypothetical protein
MSQSSAVPAGNDAPTQAEEEPEPLSFTLVVVSPSVGVNNPLTFPHLPATTTVKQLKAKIRDALPSKPVDESQRLIHRGRMLGREVETMLEIFGQETVSRSHYLHKATLLIIAVISWQTPNHRRYILPYDLWMAHLLIQQRLPLRDHYLPHPILYCLNLAPNQRQ